ncbi:MAG: hypothetical protein NT072_00040 [Deltaproteobacteria bacterium]|nr:hypothetical protein [Deltaproteobacteria bacterium]
MEAQTQGLVKMTGTVVERLIESPNFKENVKAVLRNIDPGESSDLVKTLLWKDPELFLAMLGALPVLLNVMIRLMDEMLNEINEKFSPELLRDFVQSLADDIDKDSARRLVKNGTIMYTALAPVFVELWREIESGTPPEGKEGGHGSNRA